MRRATYNNVLKATKMIMAKGYDRDEANDIALKCFEQVNKNTLSVEFFIDKVRNKEEG